VVDASLGVIRHTLFEEVGLALKGDHVHEVEGVGDMVDLLIAEGNEQTISHELDVLAHEIGVHADEGDRERLGQELLLNDNGLLDNLLHELGVGPPPEVTEQEASEVGVHTLITRDEFVREGQAGHKTAFLEPENGREGAAEKDALYGGECD